MANLEKHLTPFIGEEAAHDAAFNAIFLHDNTLLNEARSGATSLPGDLTTLPSPHGREGLVSEIDRVSAKIAILQRQQFEILQDINELETAIVSAEGISTINDIVGKGSEISLLALSGSGIIRGFGKALVAKSPILRSLTGKILGRDATKVINDSIVKGAAREAAAEIRREAVKAGSVAVSLKALERFFKPFKDFNDNGRSAINEALRNSSRIERSLFEVTRQLNKERALLRELQGN